MIYIAVWRIKVFTWKEAYDRTNWECPYLVDVEWLEWHCKEIDWVCWEVCLSYSWTCREVFQKDDILRKLFCDPSTGWYKSDSFYFAKEVIDDVKRASFSEFPELKEWFVTRLEKAIELFWYEAVIYLN